MIAALAVQLDRIMRRNMSSSEYLRELRCNQAVVLMTKWLQNKSLPITTPVVIETLPVIGTERYRRFFVWTSHRPAYKPLEHHFRPIPGSGGDLLVAQNLRIAVKLHNAPTLCPNQPYFSGGLWRIFEPEDADVPMAALDRIIELLRN
jgi:hypothetical protein